MPAAVLIINADDLGLWPSVDAGILQAWESRAISDCSVLANAPYLREILRAAQQAGLPVGVHLNLTLGRPVSDPAEIPDLVTAEGLFMKREHWPAALPIEQVRLELQRQVRLVRELGGQPTHLDSHHHVHRYPEIFTVTVDCARDLGVPVRAVNAPMREALRRAGVTAPDHFSMAFYGEQATVVTLIRLAEECPGGTMEIMTHPGHSAPDLPSSYRVERELELAALCSPAWREYRRKEGIPLIGFTDIT